MSGETVLQELHLSRGIANLDNQHSSPWASRKGRLLIRSGTPGNPTNLRVVDQVSGSDPFVLAHYLSAKLHELRALPDDWDGNGAIPARQPATHAMYRLITRLADQGTVFPFLVPDGEGGVLAEWRAENQRINIEASETGELYVYARDHLGMVVMNEPVDGKDAEIRLRKLLADLSSRVRRQNPSWRQLFDL